MKNKVISISQTIDGNDIRKFSSIHVALDAALPSNSYIVDFESLKAYYVEEELGTPIEMNPQPTAELLLTYCNHVKVLIDFNTIAEEVTEIVNSNIIDGKSLLEAYLLLRKEAPQC